MKPSTVILVIVSSLTAGMLGATSLGEGWRWRHAIVDPAREHLELAFGSTEDSTWDDWQTIARVGPPVDGVFPVQFAVPRDDRPCAEAIAAVRRELDYYLVELGADDPWAYAIHHTQTSANLYSHVHWQRVDPDATR